MTTRTRKKEPPELVTRRANDGTRRALSSVLSIPQTEPPVNPPELQDIITRIEVELALERARQAVEHAERTGTRQDYWTARRRFLLCQARWLEVCRGR